MWELQRGTGNGSSRSDRTEEARAPCWCGCTKRQHFEFKIVSLLAHATAVTFTSHPPHLYRQNGPESLSFQRPTPYDGFYPSSPSLLSSTKLTQHNWFQSGNRKEDKMSLVREDEPKVEILGADDTNLTFVLRDEDHTLGNALRYILMRNPHVKFCGYSIPHPSENIMNIRVETFGKSASQLFRKAIVDLKDMADHMRGKFTSEHENFMAMQNESSQS